MATTESPRGSGDWRGKWTSTTSWKLPWNNRANKLPGLCARCSTIDFDQFASPPASVKETPEKITRTLISLFDIIKNERDKKCHFCTLLFDAIAIPRHDPFEHPAVKNHMPDLKHKTFGTWAKGIKWHDKILNSPHPFGQGRNKVVIGNDPEDPDKLQEFRDQVAEAAQQTVVITAAIGTGATAQAATTEKNKDKQAALVVASNATTMITSFVAVMDYKLPVTLAIKIHNITDVDAGLIEIRLWGYGSKVQAPLIILTKFNLRVASNSMIPVDELSLRYGRAIGEKVNVKGHCLEWLDHCRQHHRDSCAEPDWFSGLPTPSGAHFRLIEIQGHESNDEQDQDEPRVNKNRSKDNEDENCMCRVVQVDIKGGVVPEYAALSYVWGDTGANALNLYERNASKLERQIDGHEKKVARTISDAIKVAKRLGIRYLWADSLCVVQKELNPDEGKEAREAQLIQMDRIFGHAAVVIIAAAGEDSEAGLAGISSTREPQQMAKAVRPNVNVLLPVDYDKSYGKWDTRGWTLQEKLLSRRMLVFGETYASFHCRHGILREDMPATHAGNGPPSIPHLSMPPNSNAPRIKKSWNGTPTLLRSPFFSEYAKLLEQYTGRDMTNSNDILNGMLGLLKVLEKMRNSSSSPDSLFFEHGQDTQVGDHTLYGLPEEFLDLALLWQPPAVIGTYLTKRANDNLPSWSWAGWEVSKNPSHGQDSETDNKAHPGVRFEEPFWVSGNDDMTLRKFLATGDDAEERFRPLVMWYKCHEKQPPKPTKLPPPLPPKRFGWQSTALVRAHEDTALANPQIAMRPQAVTRPQPATNPQPESKVVPVNRWGLGIVYDRQDDADVRAMEKVLKFRETDSKNAKLPYIEPAIRLNRRHLVCETQVARFRLRGKISRKEPLWTWNDAEKVAEIEKELEILESEILDESKEVVGYMIPTDQRKTISSDPYDMILLSESQYWGNEKRIDIMGYPLYNVMLVEWDEMGWFATRTGVGKISKPAWRAANQGRKRVILK